MRRILLFIFCYFLFFVSPSFADEPQFSVAQESIYTIKESGEAQVTKNFILTNLTSEYFPQEYIYPTPNQLITNLSGPTGTYLDKDAIHIKFNTATVGKGKVVRWTLTYTLTDIALKRGLLWEVNLPQEPNTPGLISHVSAVNVLESFGKKVLESPLVYDTLNRDVPVQIFGYDFKYHLYNSRLYPTIIEIALPRDTRIEKISPKPFNVVADEQKNWRGQFQLGPVQKLDVAVEGIATLAPKSESPIKIYGIATSIKPQLAVWTKNSDFNHLPIFEGTNPIHLPDEFSFTPLTVIPNSPIPVITANLNVPKSVTAGFPQNIELAITNLGPGYFTSETVSVDDKLFITGDIPPYGHKEFTFTRTFTKDSIINLRFGLTQQTYPVSVVPLYKNSYLLFFALILGIGIVSLITQIARGISIQKHKR